MFKIVHGDVEKTVVKGKERIYAKNNNRIIISDEAMKVLQKKWQEKVENGGFTYW